MPPERTTKLCLQFKNQHHWEANCNSPDFRDLITKTKNGKKLVALYNIKEVEGKLEVTIKYQQGTSVYDSVVEKFCKNNQVKLQYPEWRRFSAEDEVLPVFEKMQPVAEGEEEEEAKLRESRSDNLYFHDITDLRDLSSTNVSSASNASTDTQLKQEMEILKKDNEKLKKDNEKLRQDIEEMKMDNETFKDWVRRFKNDCIYYEGLLKKNGINPLEYMDDYPKDH